MIDTRLIASLFPTLPNPHDFEEPLSTTFSRFSIDTPLRQAAFLAQTGHESGGFRLLSENLNYSAKRLREVFPKYFPDEATAVAYAKQPEKIANRVYASRMGNGPESSGDGFLYRGRGAIQLTGKQNYARFAAAMRMRIDEVVIYAETIPGACMSAGWFWDINNLNTLADGGEDKFEALTRRINGGTHGLKERLALFRKASGLLGA